MKEILLITMLVWEREKGKEREGKMARLSAQEKERQRKIEIGSKKRGENKRKEIRTREKKEERKKEGAREDW